MRTLLLFGLFAAVLSFGAGNADADGLVHRSFTVIDPDRPDRDIAVEVYHPPSPPSPLRLAVIGHATMTECDRYAPYWTELGEAGWLVALPGTEMHFACDQRELALDLAYLIRLLRDNLAGGPPDLPEIVSGPAALVGHSLGGGAAILAAAENPDVGAVVALAPQERIFSSMLRAAPDVITPTLILAASEDCLTPPADHQIPLYERLGAPLRALVMVNGGSHCAFALDDPDCLGAEAQCPPAWVPAERQLELSLALALTWLDGTVAGNAAALDTFLTVVDDAPELSAETTVHPVEASETAAAQTVVLSAPGPNPSAGSTAWRLDLAQPVTVTVAVYDLQGRKVRELAAGEQPAGVHHLKWDGRDTAGRETPAGLYLLKVRAGRSTITSRVLIAR